MTFLYVTSQLWRERCRLLRRSRVRRLPPHGWSPFRSCLRLVLCQLELSFGILISLRHPKSHRGLSPHKFTPVPGVHRVRAVIADPPSPHHLSMRVRTGRFDEVEQVQPRDSLAITSLAASTKRSLIRHRWQWISPCAKGFAGATTLRSGPANSHTEPGNEFSCGNEKLPVIRTDR
jgi:hypothetical protein